MMPLNQAAWINSAGQKPLTVGAAPMPKPGPREIVIKNAVVAIVCQESRKFIVQVLSLTSGTESR